MMMKKRVAAYVVVALVGILLGAGLMIGCSGQSLAKPNSGAQIANLNNQKSTEGISDARNTPLVRAAQAVAPAVVGITNKAYARDYFDHKVLVEQGEGSGVIIDANGYIATNNHVVDGAQELVVSLPDGRTFPGKVLGADPATDLAVVKIEATDLPVATLGDSDNLLVGEPAIAIGNPLGLEFQGSVTAGVISALNRSIDIGERKFKLIQTDAAINPGNSGGALVNADGLVIGINSAKIAVSGVEGIGFSIPINTARPILQSLIDKGRVIRAYLGVGVLDKNTAPKYGYTLQIDAGVYVVNITAGGPADKAGIKPGDVITKVAGTAVNTVSELRSILDTHPVGSNVDVEFIRNDQTQTVSVLLTELPAQ
jgi:serine protease Do